MTEATGQAKAYEEWLGDIATEALLQNLVNTNEHVSSINAIRLGVPKGFTVTAEIEHPGTAQAKLVRILLEPR